MVRVPQIPMFFTPSSSSDFVCFASTLSPLSPALFVWTYLIRYFNPFPDKSLKQNHFLKSLFRVFYNDVINFKLFLLIILNNISYVIFLIKKKQ